MIYISSHVHSTQHATHMHPAERCMHKQVLVEVIPPQLVRKKYSWLPSVAMSHMSAPSSNDEAVYAEVHETPAASSDR